MIRRTFFLLIVLSASLFCTASAQQSSPIEPLSTHAAKDEGTDLVVARVSGRPITEKQVVSTIKHLAILRELPLDRLQHFNAVLYKDSIDSLIRRALLENQVRQQNIKIDKVKVDQRLQQLSQRHSSPKEYLKAMADQGITEAELRRKIEEDLGMQEVVDRAVKNSPEATDEEIRKFYDDRPDKFPIPEQIRASHILLKVDPKGTQERKAEAKKKLEGILADIKAKTITFAEATKKYSQDSSNAHRGGDLGFFIRGKMAKPFEDAAFAAKPGTLSSIIETQQGYHLIQVTERKPARKATLEEVKPAIKKVLFQESKQRATRKYLEDLKAKATIEVLVTQEEFAKRRSGK
jgi:peptidyl-prolyl cis-trans isomerase C